MIHELNERTRQILRLVIDAYVETGEPVGSKALSQKLGMRLSPATIRHAMADLEAMGLLYAPHTSAGRLPTETGLTVFVEGLLEVNAIKPADREKIERGISGARGQSLPDFLAQASSLLSGLSSCAGLVMAPQSTSPIRQIEFVLLGEGRILAVIVSTNGDVENRIFDAPAGATATTLQQAANYLNAKISSKTLPEVSDLLQKEFLAQKGELDLLTQKVIERGIASMTPQEKGGHLIIKGQANLLEDITALEDLERIRALFALLEEKETMMRLLDAAKTADGVKIFIGSENKLFNHAGCTLIISPYKNDDAEIIGALGVIGPTRLNYGRIIPVINYTSKIMGKIIS